MEGHFDPVVAAGEGLVDAVVDHLVDEVMEAPGARRADVHARPQTDRLEAFKNGDVFCGICGFSHEKSPANRLLAGTPNSTRTSGHRGPFAWLAAAAFATTLRRSMSRIPRASDWASATCSAVGFTEVLSTVSVPASIPSGSGPGENASRGGASS